MSELEELKKELCDECTWRLSTGSCFVGCPFMELKEVLENEKQRKIQC